MRSFRKIPNFLGIDLVLALLMALGSSCSHHETEAPVLDGDALRLRLSLGGSSEEAEWVKGDRVGVLSYCFGEVLDQNILYVTPDGDGYFSSLQPITLQSKFLKDIVAYYPYQEGLSDGQLYMDYSRQSDGVAPDYFVGRRDQVIPSGLRAPEMSLKRVNALLQVIVRGTEGFGDMRGLSARVTGLPVSATYDLYSRRFVSHSFDGIIGMAVTGRRSQAVAAAVVMPGTNYGEVRVTFTFGGREISWTPSPHEAKVGELATYVLTISGTGSGLHLSEDVAPSEEGGKSPHGPIILTPDGVKGEREDESSIPIDPSGSIDGAGDGGSATPKDDGSCDQPKGDDKPIDPSGKIDGSGDGGTVTPKGEDKPIEPSGSIDGGESSDPLVPGVDPTKKRINPDGSTILPMNPGGTFTVKPEPEDVPIDPSTPGVDPVKPGDGSQPDPNDPLGNVRPGVRAAYREEAVVRDPALLKNALFIRHMAPDSWFSGGRTPGGSRRNYSILFDKATRSPRYVAFPMYPDVLGDTKRKNAWDFDPDLKPYSLQPDLSKSYSGNGSWSRGHMLASGSRTASRELNRTTFYFTNMVPQNQSQNGGQWAQLEEQERTWCRQQSLYDTLYVVCGPVYDRTPLRLTRDRSGNGVAIPDKTFKVFLRQERRTGNWYSIGFIMPNAKIPGKFDEYSTTVAEVERVTGLQFFTHLPMDRAVGIKSQNDRRHWR